MNTLLRALALAMAIMICAGAALAEECPLNLTAGEKVAEIDIPEDFAVADSAADDTEYYLAPTDAASPVRFYYYTAGSGDPLSLARAAIESYTAFYDAFEAGGIVEAPIDGRDCVRFSYTCAYPGRDGAAMVYEQTAVCYLPLDAGRFIACIVSLAFDDPAKYDTPEALEGELAAAVSAVRVAE